MTMAGPCTTFFYAFLEAISNIESKNYEPLQQFRKEVVASTSGLDPIAVSQYAEQKKSTLLPDNTLLTAFDSIRSFQETAYGEGFRFDDDHELVNAAYQGARRLSGKQKVPIAFVPAMAELVRKGLLERDCLTYLNHFIAQNAAAVHEHRLRKLEEAASAISQSATDNSGIEKNVELQGNKSLHEFTITQQALALHYLIYEALGVTGVDTTKLIALAHLLGAKKIPQKAGKDNLDNSGIKSAFRNMWQKEDRNHLADLNFVLRFLKPLDIAGAEGISKAISAIERRIEKISEKLSRHKD